MATRQEVVAALESAKTQVEGKAGELQEIENQADSLSGLIEEIAAESASGIVESIQEAVEGVKQCCTKASEHMQSACAAINTYTTEVL